MRYYYCFILLLFLFVFLCLGNSDVSSEKAALVAFRSAVGGKDLFPWNSNDSTACSWQGVRCEGNQVTVLRLPGFGLSGQIPSGTIGNLTHLRTLSLRLNALTGQLPFDLSLCKDLRNLYLQGNHFSGDIPAFIFKLENLVRLNLAGNNFSGQISSSFNNLTRLGTLYLENNQLTGSLPELTLPDLVQFNVSFNQLNGSIPMKLRSKPADSFQGNSLCGGPIGLCPNELNSNKRKKLSAGAIVGIVIGSVAGFLLVLLILLVLCRKKKSNGRSVDIGSVKQMEEEAIQGQGSNKQDNAVAKGEVNSSKKKLLFLGNGPRNFELDDLLKASAEVLGKGTFGTAYKAVLEVGIVVAVKRLKDVMIPEKEFRDKIESVGSMDHQNLVPLRAYYYSVEEKLLVYDYMSMGSLSALLHGNRGAGRTPLNWDTRSGIALGAARGVTYLHSRGPNVSHGNIKSSNILLTKSYEARVSDFGLAHLVGPSSTPSRVGGTRAPEVTDGRKVSQKADVYSFGVLLLELLTGKAPTNPLLNEEGVDLPRWVQSVVKEEWTSEVFDLELLRYQNVEEDMVQLLQLAIDCIAQYPDKRPTMSQVFHRIHELRESSLGQGQGQDHDDDDDDDGDDDEGSL